MLSRLRPLPAQHRCHLHANELVSLASGDEISHGLRAAAPQACLMLSRACVIRLRSRMAKMERPRPISALPEEDGSRPKRLELEPRPVVVQKNASVQVAHHHALA